MDLVSRIDELLIELRQARAQLDRAERLLADSRASGTFSCPLVILLAPGGAFP